MRQLFLLLFALHMQHQYAQEQLTLGPNSQVFQGIEKGELTKHTWSSKMYDGTLRDYYVYVPAQYDGSSPAALMIFQDGHTYVKPDGHFRAPTVLDNLIAQQKMPITIALFINPGHDVGAPAPESPWRVTNRGVEYNTLSDKYAEFLMSEMIPELKKKYLISDDPRMRAVCGISSGGICAFTVAWSKPEAFHKVLSHIGSFTDIAGGHNYPSMIRKSDKKPIKVFLQDGINDLDNRFGNWWLSNLQMEAALKFKDYEYRFAADTGAHNGAHGGLILAESLTWLWSDQVPDRVPSKVYHADEIMDHQSFEMISGETMHLAQMRFSAMEVIGQASFYDAAQEQLFIVRKGRVAVNMQDRTETIGPNSVIFLLPGDSVDVKCEKDTVKLYHMIYQSRAAADMDRGRREGGSFVLDFDRLTYREHDKGSRRDYFNKSTAMCPYYEMHVTTLNPGFKSHEPHTHLAEELIIMIDGDTEEEIGNKVYRGTSGDVYFLGAHVPHAIRNVGDQRCMYFAFQWY